MGSPNCGKNVTSSFSPLLAASGFALRLDVAPRASRSDPAALNMAQSWVLYRWFIASPTLLINFVGCFYKVRKNNWEFLLKN